MEQTTQAVEDAIDAVEAAEERSHQFEPVDVLAKRYAVTTYGLLHAFEGRVLFVKFVAGKPRLRTVDVERVFGC